MEHHREIRTCVHRVRVAFEPTRASRLETLASSTVYWRMTAGGFGARGPKARTVHFSRRLVMSHQ
eukprot:scaffold15844_cov59-Cylindrotheca_fusiformis.AAC.1